jgi:C1A family cysteine protease
LQSISTGTPVIVGFNYYDDFKTYKDGIYKIPHGQTVGLHVVVIVGYSDDKHAYHVMNSWGASNWGKDGFAWIDYDTLDSLATIKGLYRVYIILPLRHQR